MEYKVAFWYDNKDSIKQVIWNKINKFRPDLLITYDSEIGGYGHPEHMISAQLTEDIFRENENNAEFRPKTLFQITLSAQLEEFLVAKSPGYKLFKNLTGSDGLPDPDIAVNIIPYWADKNRAAQCYASELKTLRKFFLVYDDDDQANHVNAFSKEYYKVLER
jgi:LmbE family N-acetylglucosaminyl deacetylase